VCCRVLLRSVMTSYAHCTPLSKAGQKMMLNAVRVANSLTDMLLVETRRVSPMATEESLRTHDGTVFPFESPSYSSGMRGREVDDCGGMNQTSG